jgi:hypothetical protein
MHRLRYIGMDELSYRNIWIALAVVMPIGLIGLILLRDDPTAKGYLTVACIFGACFLHSTLNQRERRRKGLLPSQQQRR